MRAVMLAICLGGCTGLLGVHDPSQVPDRLTLDSPAGQTGIVGSELAEPISVTIVDGNGVGVAGIPVHFVVTTGGGQLSAQDLISDAQGHARSALTLGTTAGENSVEVRANDVLESPLTFTATGLAGPPSASGSTVSASAGTVIADGMATAEITVTLKDAFNNPIVGQAVLLAATGNANMFGQPGVTDASGIATGTIASTRAEPKMITASAGATALAQRAMVAFGAGPPSRLLLTSGDNQQGTGSGLALPAPFVVTVEDATQNPVGGVMVAFVVVAGGGTITSPNATTNALGHAQTTLTLGPTSAPNRVEARLPGVSGSPVVFTATPYGFDTKVDFPTGTSPFSVALGDLNGDGKLDLAIANDTTPGSVSILFNTTAVGANAPSFAAKVDFPTGTAPTSVALGDFNGDGKLDLAVANEGPSTVSVLLNTTAVGAATPSFAAKVDFATGSQPKSVAVGDFNGDAKPDLAIANIGPSTVSILLGTTIAGATTPSFDNHKDFPTGAQPISVAIGDLDADGKLDLALANRTGNTVSVLRGTTAAGSTSPTFAQRIDLPTGTNPESVAIGDVDGDTKLDLVVANRTAGSVSVLLNTTVGAPSFAAKGDFATGAGPVAVAIGDLTGDGKPDLALANFGGNTVSTLIGRTALGDPASFAATIDFPAGANPTAVAIGDLNGDGRLDLVVTNQTDNTVSILLHL
ncbi:MAG: repeat protein [Deltaproteobacteria bacterium]|nr:repeat protein [Deltaproteobacteria bacterium]